jgi:hypothetical protein
MDLCIMFQSLVHEVTSASFRFSIRHLITALKKSGAHRALRCRNWPTATTAAYTPCAAQPALRRPTAAATDDALANQRRPGISAVQCSRKLSRRWPLHLLATTRLLPGAGTMGPSHCTHENRMRKLCRLCVVVSLPRTLQRGSDADRSTRAD